MVLSLDQYNTPNDDPTLFADPMKQQKLAENVLSQLGLHPDQQGAKSLLDAHFTGPTGSPEVKSVTSQPLVDTASMPAAGAEPPKTDTASVEPLAAPVASSEPAPKPAPSGGSAATSLPSIPPPVGNANSQLIVNSADQRTEKAQNEKNRLIDTGSGISQIHNPFLRGLARVGEVAGSAVVPNLVHDIPGTEQHHNELIRQQSQVIDSDEKTKKEEADVNHTNAMTESEEGTVKELTEWMKENPGVPISQYWKDKAKAQNLKLTPQQSVMKYLTDPESEGGMALPPDEAFKRTQAILTGSKPPTAAQATAKFQDLVSKVQGGQPFDPKMMSDMPTLVKAIGDSANLTPQEKQDAFSFLVSHNTPASSAYAANTRASTMRSMRLSSGINSQGQPVFVTPEMVAKNPTEYMPGTLGEHAMSKGQAFADIDFNTENVDQALHGLKEGFTPETSAQLAFALRSSDPHSAFGTFMTSEVGRSLTPDQIDLVTALASLNENALALRSIQGLGQGSDELRAAITRMVPGAGTPNLGYADRQMELLKGTVERAKQGIPKSNVHLPPGAPAKTTQQLIDEHNPANAPAKAKTVSRAAVEAEVKQLNEANKGNKGWKTLTIEDAIEDAKQHNITVK